MKRLLSVLIIASVAMSAWAQDIKYFQGHLITSLEGDYDEVVITVHDEEKLFSYIIENKERTKIVYGIFKLRGFNSFDIEKPMADYLSENGFDSIKDYDWGCYIATEPTFMTELGYEVDNETGYEYWRMTFNRYDGTNPFDLMVRVVREIKQ